MEVFLPVLIFPFVNMIENAFISLSFQVKDKRNMKNVNEISGAKKAKRSATQPHEGRYKKFTCFRLDQV